MTVFQSRGGNLCAALFVMLFLLVNFAEAAGRDTWYMNGKYQAKIDALRIQVENANGIISGGLVVDCWRSTGTLRVWVRDILVDNNEVVEYKTGKISGSFRANKRFVAADVIYLKSIDLTLSFDEIFKKVNRKMLVVEAVKKL